MHIALGGCLSAPPVRFGLTADTGGHIAYVLEAARAQALLPHVRRVSIVTRLFEDPRLGLAFASPSERLDAKTTIDRIGTENRAYLEKEALASDIPAFIDALCAHLERLHDLPDAVHAHFADAAFVAQAVRTRFGIPFVYTPHALGLDKPPQPDTDNALQGRITAERNAMAAADAMIVSTRNEMDRQVAAYAVAGVGARIRCMAPGIPSQGGRDADERSPALELPAFYLPARDLPALDLPALDLPALDLVDPSKPIVLAIARPVRKKNLSALVHAYATTAALRERANLVILAGQHGNGLQSDEECEVVDELKALRERYRLQGRFTLPPMHHARDVAALYRRAAVGGVFVNPALHEPFGLTLIEAAAAGVPVVATRHGGPVDIIAATGHGILVDPRDTVAIGAACLRIVSDPSLHDRLSQAARANAHRYSWPRYATESVALYASLRPRARLLASDIDNTLTGCIAGARSFKRWYRDRPLPFVVATGRSFDAARAVLSEWRLPQPDAFIVDVGTRIMLPRSDGGWEECAGFARRLDVDWDRDAVAAEVATLGLTPQSPGTAGPHKLSVFGTPSDAQAIRTTLAEARLAARVVFSHGRLIDVLAPHAGKAAALAHYAAELGFTLDHCVAAGDSGNDLDMLEACGRAIIVGNAGAELAGLSPRLHRVRVAGHHAAGVMEGLAAFGLAEARPHATPDRAAA